MVKLISPVPLKDEMLNKNKPTQPWQAWLSDLFSIINNHSFLCNDSITINPDFHWSRTKGNTPTNADGEFVEQWSVISNGMTFVITPIYYSSTLHSSLTGSDRYINIAITTINANEFSIYQKIPKKLSKIQGKKITVSSKIKNNNSVTVMCYAFIGFDLTGSGTISYSARSKSISLVEGNNDINVTIECPSISVDNQTNVVNIELRLYDLADVVNLNLNYVKVELSDTPTSLQVEHALEKFKIDNPV